MTLTAAPQGPMQLTAERAPFVMLPRWLLHQAKISDGAKVLYCVLHDLVAGREGPTRPVTRGQLAEACDVSANTIDRRLTELIDAGAVDKEPQILARGQVGNVYRVWLTPPDQRRPRVPTDGEARSGRMPMAGDLPHPWGDPLPAGEDPTLLEEEIQESPPQPPRPAGGPALGNDQTPGRRAAGTNLRAFGVNPRADAERAEADRRATEGARRQAALDAENVRRRAEAEAARAEVEAAEAEALALSGVLDDVRLAAVVVRVGEGLAGPLARLPLAVARAVVVWCRAAAGESPGPFLAAIDAALADDGWRMNGEDVLPARKLPAAPDGTPTLRERVAHLVRTTPAGEL
jgi:hypothetical protein